MHIALIQVSVYLPSYIGILTLYPWTPLKLARPGVYDMP